MAGRWRIRPETGAVVAGLGDGVKGERLGSLGVGRHGDAAGRRRPGGAWHELGGGEAPCGTAGVGSRPWRGVGRSCGKQRGRGRLEEGEEDKGREKAGGRRQARGVGLGLRSSSPWGWMRTGAPLPGARRGGSRGDGCCGWFGKNREEARWLARCRNRGEGWRRNSVALFLAFEKMT